MHEHTVVDHHHHVKSRGFLVVVLLNVVITIAEYAGGILSGSLALVSDAGHNFSDVLSLLLGYFGERVSRGQRSDTFSFGLKRFEVLTALINSLTLMVIGLYIFYESIIRFKNPVIIDLRVMLPVAFVGLAGNILSIIFLGHESSSSLNIRAAFLHLLFDAVSSLGVIAAAVTIYFTGNLWMDIVISFFIAVMIIWSSMGILKESLRIFLQGVPENIVSSEVFSEISGINGVGSVHGLHIWSINSKEVFLSCHILLEKNSGRNSDQIIAQINNMLNDKFRISHTAVQVEFNEFCLAHGNYCCD